MNNTSMIMITEIDAYTNNIIQCNHMHHCWTRNKFSIRNVSATEIMIAIKMKLKTYIGNIKEFQVYIFGTHKT